MRVSVYFPSILLLLVSEEEEDAEVAFDDVI